LYRKFLKQFVYSFILARLFTNRIYSLKIGTLLRSSSSYLLNIFNELVSFSLCFPPHFFGEKCGKSNTLFLISKTISKIFLKDFFWCPRRDKSSPLHPLLPAFPRTLFPLLSRSFPFGLGAQR